MAILNILTYPNKLLSKKAKAVKKISKMDPRLIQNMIETMYQEDGVGLAAPQVGIPEQIIVVSPNGLPGEERVYLNPEIMERSKEEEMGVEGCLSLPGISCEVRRAKTIELKALDLNGKELVETFHQFPARVIQHEIDHLNGLLIIDRVDFDRRQALLSGYRRL